MLGWCVWMCVLGCVRGVYVWGAHVWGCGGGGSVLGVGVSVLGWVCEGIGECGRCLIGWVCSFSLLGRFDVAFKLLLTHIGPVCTAEQEFCDDFFHFPKSDQASQMDDSADVWVGGV